MDQLKNIQQYVSSFNDLDKYLDKILKLRVFLPYNEKLKVLAEGRTPVSGFVRKYEQKLRFFGEIRNHLAHAFGLEGQVYTAPTDFAVQEVQKFFNALKKPITCFELFKRQVYTCKTSDLLADVFALMKKNLYTHVPVYSPKGQFVGMLTESTVAYRITDLIAPKGKVTLDDVTIGDVPLQNGNDEYLFIDTKMNVYQIEEVFSQHIQKRTRLGAVFITQHGREDEEIEGILTAIDLPTINDRIEV